VGGIRLEGVMTLGQFGVVVVGRLTPIYGMSVKIAEVNGSRIRDWGDVVSVADTPLAVGRRLVKTAGGIGHLTIMTHTLFGVAKVVI